jgi:hypothetical protein
LPAYVIYTRPGMVPERKGPYPTPALVEAALRELHAAHPDATSMVIRLPSDCYPQSGVEWIDMYGDESKGRLQPSGNAGGLPVAAIRKLLSNWDDLKPGESENVDAVREWLTAQAIQALHDGVFDNPALMDVGPLMQTTDERIAQIEKFYAQAQPPVSQSVVNQSLTTDDLPPLPKGYIVQMTPDPDSTPAEWFDETDMREYARAALAQQDCGQDKVDAERYRHVRRRIGAERTNGGKGPVSYYLLMRTPASDALAAETDAAIDADRAAAHGGK